MTVRAVCKRCNEGWMSALEQRVRPTLEPLVRGQPCTLDQAAQTTLAEWVALKTMVIEQATRDDAVLAQEDRHALMNEGRIPDGILILIGRTRPPGWWTSAMERHVATMSGNAGGMLSDNARGKNVATVALGLGALLVYVLVCRAPGLALDTAVRLDPRVPRLWPTSGGILWPLPRSLSDADAHALASSLRTLIAHPVVRWRSFDPEV